MDQNTFLKMLYMLSTKYVDNDLFKFFVEKNHRLIHKWLHYFPIYDKWFKDFRGTDLVGNRRQSRRITSNVEKLFRKRRKNYRH